MAKLTDLCDIQYGYAFDSALFTDDCSYPQLVRIRDVKRGYSETFYNGDYPEEYVLSAGDLLIGMDGEFNIARWKVDGALLNQRVCKITAKDNADEEFLRFALSKALKVIEERTSFATVKHLSAKELNKLEIAVPSYGEQKNKSEILRRLERIIKLRQNELNSLDNLIKARFVEMFGEGLNDDGKYPLLSISEIGKVVSGATPKTSNDDYWDGENLWITPAELTEDSFVVFDTERKITDEGVNSCAVHLLPVGTVILSSRAPIGKVAIAGAPMYCNQGFKNIIPNEKINSVYLFELLSMETEYLNSLGRGATFKEISKQIVESIRIKVPPKKIQNRFAEFVKQVDKSKVVVQKALDEAQILFDSLMQEYFG